MDSTAVQAINDNTTALMAFTGTVWVFMGFLAFMSVGALLSVTDDPRKIKNGEKFNGIGFVVASVAPIRKSRNTDV